MSRPIAVIQSDILARCSTNIDNAYIYDINSPIPIRNCPILYDLRIKCDSYGLISPTLFGLCFTRARFAICYARFNPLADFIKRTCWSLKLGLVSWRLLKVAILWVVLFLYWCVMRPASQRFFIHSCIYLRILNISYLATFLGTNSLSVLMCLKAVNQSSRPYTRYYTSKY